MSYSVDHKSLSALDYLLKDHEEHRSQLEKIQGSSDRARDFQSFRDGLIKHIEIEERVFYPKLLTVPLLEPIILGVWEEHSLCMQLLQEMDTLTAEDKIWTAKLSLLTKITLEHLHEEESELFPKIRKLASPEFLQEMGEEMAAHKKETVPDEVLYPEEPGSHKTPSICFSKAKSPL